MKTACLTSLGKAELIDIPEPDISGGKHLVRVKSCGLCGSDLHYYRTGKIGDAVCDYPHFMGHEPAGIVEKAPAGSSLVEGDRVAIEPGLHCGECEFCKSGRINICPNVKFLATPGIPGAFQKYLALEECQLVKIPDSISFEEAALLEPMGVAFHAVVNLAKIRKGDDVAIFGAGAIGLLTLAVAKLYGCGNAFIVDPLDYRLDFARKHAGADFTVNPDKEDALAFIMEKTNGRGVDVSFEAAGAQQSFEMTFESVAIGGKALLIGIPEIEKISFDPHSMRRKELQIMNVRRSNKTLHKCVELAAAKEIDLGPYATHSFPLEQIDEAISITGNYRDNVIRTIINP
jgi:L-iditol 2-dehydrogenase